tara:strand:+ start:3737 stop:4387 length:651 start_codon:yes stop_codon:yes gene_type:complete
MINKIIRLIKRTIISKSYFWRFREFFQPQWIESYNTKPVPEYLKELIKKNDFSSAIDFGCATGNLLFYIKKYNIESLCYGIDINKNAINLCFEKFEKLHSSNKNTFSFDTSTNQKRIQNFLEDNKIDFFEIAIFDRVLYCLNDDQVNLNLDIILKYSSCIFLDDFYSLSNKKISGYMHRDWINLLKNKGFECKNQFNSIHPNVDGANAKSFFFVRE